MSYATQTLELKDLLQVNEVSPVYKPLGITFQMANIDSSRKVADLLRILWSEDISYSEDFNLLLLNRANKALALRRVSKGGLAATTVDIRQIMQFAILGNASSIILAHNHPSGNKIPSTSDISMTDKIVQAAKFFGIDVLDHLILTPESYYSFKDNGDI